MLKARIADWVLSLVLDRERSAAAVGDLMEEGSSAARFWISAVRIFVCALWDSFGASRLGIVRLTALGLLFEFLYMMAMIGIIVGSAWVLGTLGTSSAWLTAHAPSVGFAFGLGLLLLIEFQVGKRIARWSPGQELAVCVAVTCAGAMLSGVIDMGVQWDFRRLISSFFAWSTPAFVAHIAFFAGAVSERRRRVALG